MDDYLSGEGRARSFLPGAFDDPEAFRDRAARASERFGREERQRVVDMVRAPAPETRDRLRRWVEEEGYLVTTGQQPGLFTGPLYTVYKALTAIRLAQALEELLDAPVLPLFWVASEDHDWEEAHDTWLVGTDNELHHVELPDPPDEELGRPLHRVRAHLEEALDHFLEHLPDTDFSGEYVELLRECWEGGATLPDAFRCTLEGLLGSRGLLFVDAHAPELKRASEEVLRRELHGSGDHEERLRARAVELEDAGYHVQVPILEGGVNLFVEGPAGRERLYRDDGTFHLRHSEKSLSASDVEEAISAEPSTVSPNVLLRPVVEAAVFPTVAYVAGPGEMAYFAQLQPLFDAHGIHMPVIHPRHSVTVVESKVAKVLEKFDLEIEVLDRPFHELASEIVRDEVPDDIQKALGRIRGAVGQGTSELTEAARAVDPTLKGPISHARSVAFDALAEAEKKIVQAVKRENEIALQQLEKAQVHLFPHGKPQERVMNVFYYLVRYGDGFLRELAGSFEVALPSRVSKG